MERAKQLQVCNENEYVKIHN